MAKSNNDRSYLQRIRLANLEILISEFGTIAALAKQAKITHAAQISMIRIGAKTPKGTPRGIGDALAAKLEKAAHKPAGWMSVDHSETPPPTPAANPPDQIEPILAAWHELPDPIKEHFQALIFMVAGYVRTNPSREILQRAFASVPTGPNYEMLMKKIVKYQKTHRTKTEKPKDEEET